MLIYRNEPTLTVLEERSLLKRKERPAADYDEFQAADGLSEAQMRELISVLCFHLQIAFVVTRELHHRIPYDGPPML